MKESIEVLHDSLGCLHTLVGFVVGPARSLEDSVSVAPDTGTTYRRKNTTVSANKTIEIYKSV